VSDPRAATIERTTRETSVKVELRLDGAGDAGIDTGIPFFDHMLRQFGPHGGFDLTVRAAGDLEIDGHHTVEDVGLVMGEALSVALGTKEGIRRFGSAAVPLDEALVEVVLDLSGRPFVMHDVDVPGAGTPLLGSFDPGLTEDFVRALANAGGITLHVRKRSGRSPHHVLEAEFKALARALGDACALAGPRGAPSTKGIL
jgi:imidazoleglycerol-phosphate dehydratase